MRPPGRVNLATDVLAQAGRRKPFHVLTEHASGAAEARHHLVGDQQHAVFVADLANQRPILGRFVLAGLDGILVQDLAMPNGARTRDALNCLIKAAQALAAGMAPK